MTTTTNYFNAAQTYAEGVRTFFASGLADRGERAGSVSVSISELTHRAEVLAPFSAGFTSAAAAQLALDDSALRIQASIGLLAKALTDLEVSKALFSAAEDQQGGLEHGRPLAQVERSAMISCPAHLDDTLHLLLGAAAGSAALAERGSDLPATVAEARMQVASIAETTLMLIRDRAASTGYEALSGVAGLGAGKLAEAIGLATMGVAEIFGQAAQLAGLYALVRDFLNYALTSLQTLFGQALTQMIGDQVAGWIKEATSDKRFAQQVDKLYATAPTGKALAKLSAESSANLPNYIAAIQGIDALEVAYRKQVDIVTKLLKVLKFVAVVPALALPQGRLLMAAAYLLAGGYIVLAGADYVDAQRLTLFDRVPGVRKIVEANLA